ncbi:hypothetical protein PFLA_a3695 [Pseudoalteromonas flavipulchra NCIMB 2033 = ATCC BAA-314]|nr:hypothetical protein [Pseudoalteromonas flavipulchra NCIMB 2033 = ATCC BAA-314]
MSFVHGCTKKHCIELDVSLFIVLFNQNFNSNREYFVML